MQNINYPQSPAFRGSYLIENIGTKNPADATYNMSLKFAREAEFYEDNDDWHNAKMNVVCESWDDKKIERYMIEKGIKFKKYTEGELYDFEKIQERMIKDEHYNYGTLKTANLKKLTELWKTTDSDMYIAPDRKDKQQQDVLKFIKSGMKIHAPNICITEGQDGPMLSVYDGRHRLAVFEGMGMDKIKVNFLGEESLTLARKYGIIK